jgi:DNA-binding SARP family transcriptional activator/TolB-like protein
LLRIRCFGQLSVVRDGQPLAGAAAQPRRLAILALLARAGDRGLSREKAIGYLWSDSDEERARRLLSQAVYMLRRDLGSDDAIVGARDLRLGSDVITSDVAEFQEALNARSYERAAALYDGPFLDGFHLPGAPEFERWVDDERRALEHDAATAFEKCALACEARGDHASAVTWWRRLAANDPVNARVAVRLMRALAAAGDRNGAIRHAAIHEALVQEHLELPPDVEVMRLAEELRSTTHETVAPVVPQGVAPHAPTMHEPEVVESKGTASPPLPASGRRSRRKLALAAGVLGSLGVIAAAVAWIVLTERTPAHMAVPVPSRVVVAPLENRTGDPAFDAIGAMVAEWVTQGLLRTGLVQVVDTRTMLETARDAGPSRDADYLRKVAEQTGAGMVVSGSYFVEGDELRFLTRVTGAPSGEVRHTVDVVSAPIARPTAALEPLRQRVIGALAVLLDRRLNNWTAGASQPPTYEAYAEFLLGMETFGRDYDNSVRHFTRAAQLDSSYWQALLWAGMSYANLRRYPPADSLFRILDHNRAKLAAYDEANLDYFYGGFVRGDWETSYGGARRMVTFAPAAAHALYAAGLTAQITNRPREAVEVLQRIDMREGWAKAWAPRVLNLLARSHHQLGEYEQDLEWAKQLRESERNVGWTHLAEVRALAALGRDREAVAAAVDGATFPVTTETWEDYSPGDFLWQAGRELRAHGSDSVAREVFQRADRWYASRPVAEQATRAHRLGKARILEYLERPGDAREIYAALAAEDTLSIEYLGGLGATSARLGRFDEADSIAARLVGDPRPFTFGAPRFWAARIAAVKGDRGGAVALLHRARREGHARLYLYHTERDFDGLRDFPAFRELLQQRTSPP